MTSRGNNPLLCKILLLRQILQPTTLPLTTPPTPRDLISGLPSCLKIEVLFAFFGLEASMGIAQVLNLYLQLLQLR
jgi:hypothetical protein